MSATPEQSQAKGLTYRRYKEGDSEYRRWQDKIIKADETYKCPTYVLQTPPCQGSCPAGEDIRGYLNIVRGLEKPPVGADGKPSMPWQEFAWRRLTQANPFPAVMGRVCPAPCESGCNRNKVEDHVGINSVEHFLGEYALTNNLQFAKPADWKPSGRKVALIGGGPASLSAAYQLTLKGHACTIFEEHEELGGMMRYGIPGFRTPKDVLDKEIARVVNLGVEVRTKTRVGTDISLDQLRSDFDAIFVGVGAQAGRPIDVPGSNAPNVVTGMAFLRAFNDGRLQHVGQRVVVIGGGDTSIDVATVAKRLGHIDDDHGRDHPEHVIAGQIAHDVASVSSKKGAEVILISRAAEEKMSANKHEIEQAKREGIEIRGGVTPVEVILGADGRARALKVGVLELVGKEKVVKAGSEYEIPADLIVAAIGQAVDFTGMEAFNNGKGLMNATRNYEVPGQKGVFVGGDVLRPHLLTTAVGHGSIAAESIDAYLAGAEAERRPKVDVHHFDVLRNMMEKGKTFEQAKEALHGSDVANIGLHNYEFSADRQIIPQDQLFLGHFGYVARKKREVVHLDDQQVLGHFQELLQPLDEKSAIDEAKRCISCGLCFECDNCIVFCPQAAVRKVPKAQASLGRYVTTDYEKCVGCHICKDVCPTGYIQMGLGE